jgi:hypothetical protein
MFSILGSGMRLCLLKSEASNDPLFIPPLREDARGESVE